MSWTDRIRQAAYTSPSGKRLTFDFENVAVGFDKRTAAFDFPGVDGTYVQDNGRSGRRYPLRVFFWGADYDEEADAFLDALGERGDGRLEHPMYGTVDVVPMGSITRRDDLKDAANQAIFEINFFETTGIIYPSSQASASGEVLGAIGDYNETSAEEFGDVLDLDSALETVTFASEYDAFLTTASNALAPIAKTLKEVETQFNAIKGSIDNGIETLIGQPLALAFQTVLLIQAPARALSAITDKLGAYGNLLDAIISGNGANVNTGNNSLIPNRFHNANMYASGFVSASVVSVVNNQFETKTAALEAAEVVLAQMDRLVVWRDDNFEALEEIDTGAAYQALQEAVALAAGFLVEISFSLKQERRIVLDRGRTIIDLAAEIYGSVDDQLDFLINSNELTGSEILELPMGKEIVYYV